MKRNILVLLVLIIGIFNTLKAEKDSTSVKAKPTNKVFASIYTGAYYNFETKKPNAGFELSTALLGYKFQYSNDLKFTLIYDVTRTTNGINVLDSNGNSLPVYYFEGSKYTAFLKMAEIKWQFHKNFTLSAGQMLNEQYLTITDKIWAHRYIITTMQEAYRMAMPADFGMRVEYKNKETFALSLGANNGNGPFRHQDQEALMEYTSNLEIYLIKNLLVKAYIALTPTTYDTDEELKTSFSGLIAYQNDLFTLGSEYSYTNNAQLKSIDYSGLSTFGYYNVTPKFQVLARYDYVDNSPVIQLENVYIGGFQYKPKKNLFLSLNYRYWQKSEIQQVYFNLGAKF